MAIFDASHIDVYFICGFSNLSEFSDIFVQVGRVGVAKHAWKICWIRQL
jgi:hypothetical protein